MKPFISTESTSVSGTASGKRISCTNSVSVSLTCPPANTELYDRNWPSRATNFPFFSSPMSISRSDTVAGIRSKLSLSRRVRTMKL